MSQSARYRRAVLKLSGEALCPPGGFGIDIPALQSTAAELAAVHELGVQTAIVIGGGNFLRGKVFARSEFIPRTTADAMGMLATVMNALALQEAMERAGIPTRVLSAVPTPGFCEPFILRRALRHLEKGRMLVLAGGTGHPFFSTDTCAALRASELSADVLLKATKVDGVFDADPVVNPSARKFDRLTYGEVLGRQLGVMDLAAVSLCLDAKIPVIVFRLHQPGNLAAAVRGDHVGTIISV